MRDKERERLYYLFQESKCPAHFLDNKQILDTADYLLANGVVVPPCKVGDTLWVQWSRNNAVKEKIYPVKVYALRFDTKKNNMRICVEGKFKITDFGGEFTHYYNGTFTWNSVGKTVFLTREEAEQKLKERRRDEQSI